MAKASAFQRALAQRLRKIERARTDPNDFVEYVFDVRQEPCHRRWQELWGEHRRSVLLAPVGTGKTTQLRGRLLHEYGKNHDERFIYLSATEEHPKRQAADMKDQLERNARVRHVFPNLKRGRDWQQLRFTVDRELFAPEASLQAYGAFAQGVLGSRAGGLVIDDLCNFTNTLTAELRDKMANWMASVISRLTIPGSKPWIRAIGHIWHAEDQLQRLSKKKGWGYLREEAWREEADGTRIPLAPSVLPLEVIDEKIGDLGPIMSELMLRNRLPSEGAGRFREDDFFAAFELGRGLPFRPHSWKQAPTFTGVDLGHKKKPGSDYTAIVTIAVLPDGMRQLIDARRGRWKGISRPGSSEPSILSEIRDVQRRYGSVVAVEDNGGQHYILSLAQELTAMPVVGHTTGVAKWHFARGVDSWARELAQERWLLPCPHGAPVDRTRGVLRPAEPAFELTQLKQEALDFDPTKRAEHTGDLLMAMWIAREAVEKFSLPTEDGPGLETDPIDFLTR